MPAGVPGATCTAPVAGSIVTFGLLVGTCVIVTVASGTLRILDAEAWENAGPLIEELVDEVIAPYGVTAHLTYTCLLYTSRCV